MARFHKLEDHANCRLPQSIAVVLVILLAPCFYNSNILAQDISPAAKAQFQKGLSSPRIETKIRHFTKALTYQPNYDDAIYNLGICYFRTRQYQKCIDLLTRFYDQASPYFNEAGLYLRSANTFRANELIKEERYDQALFVARQALYIDKNYAPGLTTLGTAYFHLRDFDSAIRTLKRSVAIDSMQENAWNFLGDAFMRREAYYLAQKAYERVLQISPKNREAQFHLNVSKKRNRPEIWLQRYEAAIANHDLSQGIEVLEQAIVLHPGNVQLANRLRQTTDERDYQLAIHAMEQENWQSAYELLHGINPTFKDTDSRLLQVKSELIIDSMATALKQDSLAIRRTATAAKKRETKVSTPHRQRAPVELASARPLAKEDKTQQNNLSQNNISGHNQTSVEKSATEPGKPATGMTTNHDSATLKTQMEPQQKTQQQIPHPIFRIPQIKRFAKSWPFALIATALLTIFIALRIRRANQVLASRVSLLESTLREKAPIIPQETVHANGSNKVEGDTFYDKIASETPVTFDKLSTTQLFDQEQAETKTGPEFTMFSLQETKTIIGGIKQVHRLGRYIIEKEIGRGSMGLVYKAWDPKLDRTVVIKQMAFTADRSHGSARLKDRLYREARAAGKLNHPNIVIIYDVEEDDNCSYIVMEYLEGQNLRTLMDEQTLSPVRTIDIVGQICKAMEFAHKHDIIHRDIKPSNIMISNDKVKVADFGIAQLPHFGTLTRTGDIVGTPFYMSPEQVEGRKVDGRSDIFCTGVLLYEMLTGHRPFEGDNIPSVVYKIVHQKPKPLSKRNKQLTIRADKVIALALEKDPAARYATASEFRKALFSLREELMDV